MSKYRVIEVIHGDEYQVHRGDEHLCDVWWQADAERIVKALQVLDAVASMQAEVLGSGFGRVDVQMNASAWEALKHAAPER